MFVHIAAYKFVRLDRLAERRQQLTSWCAHQRMKGSILLSSEGIQLFLAGTREAVGGLLQLLRSDPALSDLQVRESFSTHLPFRRLRVKIKREIIAFGVAGILPDRQPSAVISPQQLKQWLDEGRALELLDVRNAYEVRLGTFRGARHLSIDHFREFPLAARRLPAALQPKPLVLFCTGGIRCEKAVPYLRQQGFQQVFQLQGGILNYFEQCGSVHYDGDCFVFDQRVAVDCQLRETKTTPCFACQTPLTAADRQPSDPVASVSCPHCLRHPGRESVRSLSERQARLREICQPLPGSQPYVNQRAIRLPAEAVGRTILDHLQRTYLFVPPDAWQARFDQQLIRCDGLPVPPHQRISAGERYEHWFPDTVEPPVRAEITILHEDPALVVVHKPAPLPMHACGRYHRNTLAYLLGLLYRPQLLRLAHRLDANTSGVVLFSRTRQAAGQVQQQFADGTVAKRYLCRVLGHPPADRFACQAAISVRSLPAGARYVDAAGLAAETRFRVLRRDADGTSLVVARPITGRTHQIRIHLWHLGWPVAGDPMYLPSGRLAAKQTLRPSDPPLCLHAHRLRFLHPLSRTSVEFEARPPAWSRPRSQAAGRDAAESGGPLRSDGQHHDRPGSSCRPSTI